MGRHRVIRARTPVVVDWSTISISVDVHLALKLLADRMALSQRVLGDWLLINGMVPMLRELGKDDQLLADGANDLIEHRKEIEKKSRRVERRMRRERQRAEQEEDSEA